MKHRIVTAAQMKAIEQAGNAHGLPYLQMIEQTKEVLLYQNRPLRADPDLAFRVSARRGLIVLSEFCRPQAMQIAVGIDRHRCLVAQLKNRSGCLARMEITDVAALHRFHIEPLDNTDYPIFHLCYLCNFRFIVTSIAYCHP